MPTARLVAASLLALVSVARGEVPAAAASPGPEPMVVGLYVNQISAIDLKTNSFQVDFWIWFRSSGQGSPPLESFEIIGGRVISRTNVLRKTLAPGVEYNAARINAVIASHWDLTRFPLDHHQLRIRIEDADRESSRAVYVADGANEGIDPDVAVSGWRVAGFGHEVQEHVYRSNYGDTSAATGAETRYSRYVFRIDLRRVGWGLFFKFFFGLFVATLVSWCGFFIRPRDSSPRVSVSVGALFAASAVTVTINNQLPDTSYVTLADRLVYLSLGMILLSLFGTVTALTLHYLGREAQHRRLDRLGAILFPLTYLVGLFWILR